MSDMDGMYTETVHRVQALAVTNGIEGIEHAHILNEAAQRVMNIAKGVITPEQAAETMDLIIIGMMMHRLRDLLPDIPQEVKDQLI